MRVIGTAEPVPKIKNSNVFVIVFSYNKGFRTAEQLAK